MPYDIKKQSCEQSDGDDGSYVLAYTDKKGKKHDNCHTSKKKAQAQIGYIGELDETDDMVFGGGGDADADAGEGEDDEGLEESLLREWIREKLIAETLSNPPIPSDVTTENIGEFLDNIRTKKSDSVSVKKAEMSAKKLSAALVADPSLATALQNAASSQVARKQAFQFILASGCCGFEELHSVTGLEMAEEDKLTAILDFVDEDYALSYGPDGEARASRNIGLDIKRELGLATDRLDDEAFQQVRRIVGGKLVEKLNNLMRTSPDEHPDLTSEMIEDFREQIKTDPGSQGRGNQTRLGFEGKFDKPIRAALKEITGSGTTWEQELAEALQAGFSRTSGDADIAVVAIGRRNMNNIWTGGDYPGYLVVPSMIRDYIVDESGDLKFGEDAAIMQRLADANLIKAVMVVTQTSAGIQNEIDASEDLEKATAAGPQTLSIPTFGGPPIKINLAGAGHSSSDDEDIKAALKSITDTISGGDNAAKPDMFFKVLQDDGSIEVVGVSLKQANAGNLLSGDALLRPFVDAAIEIAAKNPKFQKALQSSDVAFSLDDGAIGEKIADASIFGGGTNKVKYLLKGDFSKAKPTLNPTTNELEYPEGAVKAYETLDAFVGGVGLFPKLVFRAGEVISTDKYGKDKRRGTAVSDNRSVRPIVTYEARGGATDFSKLVAKDPIWQKAAQEVLDNLLQTNLEPAPRLGRNPTTESIVRSYIRESLLLEELTATDVKKIIKKELGTPAARKAIRKEIDNTTTKSMIDKAFKKQFDKELKKALGVSFFGYRGKINQFVIDEIQSEVEKILGDDSTKEIVVQICKDVIIKLYRDLSFKYKPMIQRMKV